MGYFISVAIIFMATFSICYLTKKQFGIILPIVNFSIIIFLYIFGLINLLMVGLYLWLASAIALSIMALAKIIKAKDKLFIKTFFSPAVLFFIGFCLLQFIMLLKIKPLWWDEFSHWGLVVKNMYYHHNFGGTQTATTMFKGYPVGTSLFLFFFQCFGIKFSDCTLFTALNFLNVSLLLPALCKVKEQGKKISLSILLIAVILIMNYMFLLSICNDMFLSLCFAFILIMYFCFKRDGLKSEHYINIFLAIFTLGIAKSTGVALACFALLIILVDILISNHIKTCFKQKNFYFFMIGFVATILLSKISWNLYLSTLEGIDAWQISELTLKNLFAYIFQPTEYQSSSTARYFINLLIPIYNNGAYGTTRIPLILYILAIIFLIKRIKNSIGKKEAFGLYATIFSSVAIWIVGLLVLYIFTFTERETTTLSSQLRYIYCLTIGIIVFLMSYNFTVQEVSNKFNFGKKGICISLCSFALLCFVACPIINITTTQKYSEYDKFEQYISNLNKTDSVYIIDCETKQNLTYVYNQEWTNPYTLKWISHKKGLEALKMRYIATPIQSSGLLFGGSPHTGDLWNDSITPDQTIQSIKKRNYNYVYLHNINEQFKTTYADMFSEPPTPKTMYSVSFINNEMILTKIFA